MTGARRLVAGTRAGKIEYPDARAGYSLIEILVALAVLSLTLAIVVPGAVSLVSRFETYSQWRLAEDAVNNCRLLAIASGQPVKLSDPGSFQQSDADAGSCAVLPVGWTAAASAEIIFSPAAVCTGGPIELTSPDAQRRSYALDKSGCRISPLG